MMYQQNSYRDERYRIWLRESGDTTSGRRLCGLILFFLALSPFCPHTAATVLAGVFALVGRYRHGSGKYKKPLVMTMRARVFS